MSPFEIGFEYLNLDICAVGQLISDNEEALIRPQIQANFASILATFT